MHNIPFIVPQLADCNPWMLDPLTPFISPGSKKASQTGLESGHRTCWLALIEGNGIKGAFFAVRKGLL